MYEREGVTVTDFNCNRTFRTESRKKDTKKSDTISVLTRFGPSSSVPDASTSSTMKSKHIKPQQVFYSKQTSNDYKTRDYQTPRHGNFVPEDDAKELQYVLELSAKNRQLSRNSGPSSNNVDYDDSDDYEDLRLFAKDKKVDTRVKKSIPNDSQVKPAPVDNIITIPSPFPKFLPFSSKAELNIFEQVTVTLHKNNLLRNENQICLDSVAKILHDFYTPRLSDMQSKVAKQIQAYDDDKKASDIKIKGLLDTIKSNEIKLKELTDENMKLKTLADEKVKTTPSLVDAHKLTAAAFENERLTGLIRERDVTIDSLKKENVVMKEGFDIVKKKEKDLDDEFSKLKKVKESKEGYIEELTNQKNQALDLVRRSKLAIAAQTKKIQEFEALGDLKGDLEISERVILRLKAQIADLESKVSESEITPSIPLTSSTVPSPPPSALVTKFEESQIDLGLKLPSESSLVSEEFDEEILNSETMLLLQKSSFVSREDKKLDVSPIFSQFTSTVVNESVEEKEVILDTESVEKVQITNDDEESRVETVDVKEDSDLEDKGKEKGKEKEKLKDKDESKDKAEKEKELLKVDELKFGMQMENWYDETLRVDAIPPVNYSNEKDHLKIIFDYEVTNITSFEYSSGYSVNYSATPNDEELNLLPPYNFRHHKLVITEISNTTYTSGSLSISPVRVDGDSTGFLGSGKKYLATDVETIHIGAGVGKRLVLSKGMRLNIPMIYFKRSDKEIVGAFNKLVLEKGVVRNRVCLSLDLTILNNYFRTGTLIELPDDLITSFSARKPVFGHILRALKDVEEDFNIEGWNFVSSLPVGGYTFQTTKIQYGQWKGLNSVAQQYIVWDMDSHSITLDNAEKGRAILLKKYNFVFYHLYQSRHTLHWHTFQNLESAVASIACDLWTDRNQSSLKKGFPFDILWPVTEGIFDITTLAVAFYGLGIRMDDATYLKGLEGSDTKIVVPESLLWIGEMLKGSAACLATCKVTWFDRDTINPLLITHANLVPAGSAVCFERPQILPDCWSNGSDHNSNIPVFPSGRCLETEPCELSRQKQTHPLLIASHELGYQRGPISFKLPNILSFKSEKDRGAAKFNEMLDSGLFAFKGKKILIVGDYKDTWAMILMRRGVKQEAIWIIDIKYEGPNYCNVIIGDVTKQSLEWIFTFDFVISDACDAKGVLSSYFVTFYSSVLKNAPIGKEFLIKLKGLGDKNISDFLFERTKQDEKPFLMKPPSSRLRNSEAYFYTVKGGYNSKGYDLASYYYGLLETKVNVDTTDNHMYQLMDVFTPLRKMTLAEFAFCIPNNGNVELLTDNRRVMFNLGASFKNSYITLVDDRYLFQGRGFDKPTVWNLLAGRVSVCPLPVITQGGFRPLPKTRRVITENPSIIANSIKEKVVDLGDGKVIDVGCGNAGEELLYGVNRMYSAGFRDYTGYDINHGNVNYRKSFAEVLSEKITGDTLIMVQSSHFCFPPRADYRGIFDLLFSLGYKKIIYDTFKKSSITIHSGKNIWYKNDGKTITWCGEENPIVPTFGKPHFLSDIAFLTYQRKLTSEYKVLLHDRVVCVVTPDNCAPFNIDGERFNGTTNHTYGVSPNVYKDKSTKNYQVSNYEKPVIKKDFKPTSYVQRPGYTNKTGVVQFVPKDDKKEKGKEKDIGKGKEKERENKRGGRKTKDFVALNAASAGGVKKSRFQNGIS